MTEHVSCQDLLQGLSAYIDNEASEAICQAIERHLEECESCRIMLDTLRKTISLYQVVDTADQMPNEIQERLLNTLAIEGSCPEDSSKPSIES
jgi:predicted anti-sigma-YlaC factor YlaD